MHALGISTGIVSQSRVVLIEQFSNSSCPPCGAVSPSVYAFVNNTPGVAAIAYHTLFPYKNDSMHFENPVEATQRVNYYSVTGVPNSVLDGNVYNGSTNPFVSTMANLVSNRLNLPPRYDIRLFSLARNGNQLSGSFGFISLDATNAADNLVAHIVIIEKNVLKSAYAASPGANSETQYGYVMRKMIPDAAGTGLINKTVNGSDSINFDWPLKNIKNKAELRVVAFVQNASTKEIYQAQLFNISEQPVGLAESEVSGIKPTIFPNPTAGEFSISFKSGKYLKSIVIVDQLGKTVFEDKIDLVTDLVTRKVDLNPGVFYVNISTDTGTEVQKLIIGQ